MTRPDLFRVYLTEQIGLLIENHHMPVEIGESNEPIPVHFAYRRDINTEGGLSGVKLPIDRPLGVDHFGFAVDDVEAGLDAAVAAGAIPPERELPRDGRMAETFVRDPQLGVKLDISRGWLTEA